MLVIILKGSGTLASALRGDNFESKQRGFKTLHSVDLLAYRADKIQQALAAKGVEHQSGIENAANLGDMRPVVLDILMNEELPADIAMTAKGIKNGF